jgi:hypothetical protein
MAGMTRQRSLSRYGDIGSLCRARKSSGKAELIGTETKEAIGRDYPEMSAQCQLSGTLVSLGFIYMQQVSSCARRVRACHRMVGSKYRYDEHKFS